MRFFTRLGDVFRARVNALLDQLEDPECMGQQALRELEEQLDLLRQQAAMAIAVERRLAREMERPRAQAQHYREQARFALEQGREDLARWALGQCLQQQDLLSDLQTQHQAAQQASQEIKEVLQTLQDKFAAAQRRHLMLSARHRTAKVRCTVQQTLGTFNASAGAITGKLARWENRLEESADVLLALVEIHNPQPKEEAELAALESRLRVDEELAALKQESEAKG